MFVLKLPSPQSSRAKWSFEGKIVPFVDVSRGNENGDLPILFDFLLAMAAQKYI